MNIAAHQTLNELPIYDENHAVTTNPDGTVLSRVFDLKWDFSGQERGTILSSQSFTFKSVDEAYRKEIQATLATIIETCKKNGGEIVSKSQIQRWKSALVDIRDTLDSSDWASLSDDKVYAKFKSKLKKRIQESNWSRTKVSDIIAVVNKLNESALCMRKPDGKKIRKWVTKEKIQHIAIPIGMYKTLIAKALEVVETYHAYRFAINEAQKQLELIHQEKITRAGISHTNSCVSVGVTRLDNALNQDIPNFKLIRGGSELNSIQTACAMVALAFSGVRIGELSSMNKNSYQEIGGKQVPTLIGEETKRKGQVIDETWQSHKVVKDALELAQDMTQFLRTRYEEKNNNNLKKGTITPEAYHRHARQIESAFLVTKPSSVRTNYCQTNQARSFNNFIQNSDIVATQADVEEFNRLNPTREGQLKVGRTLPKLSPHDFRRSFAVFFKRYGFGSSSTIKFQYKHENINMSDYYCNNAYLQTMEDILLDNDLLAIMDEEGVRMGVDIFNEIYNESEHLGGIGGERIAKDRFERLSSGESVYMSRSEIERLIRNGTLSVVKLPTGGYCTNATCSRVCGIGEFAAEIKPCDHEVITDKQAKVILKQNKRLIKAFREMNTGDPMMNSILIGQKQKIQRNEQKIKDFNLMFEPFNDKVKGIIETVEA